MSRVQMYGLRDMMDCTQIYITGKPNFRPYSFYPHSLDKIMTNMKRLRGKDLVYQDIDDIFEDFYQLKFVMNENHGHNDINYSIIRLVTVLEQFFRYVVECSLEKKPDRTPSTIEMDPRMIGSVSESLADIPEEYVQNYVVSLAYSFQNRADIIGMMDKFDMLNSQNNIRTMINDLDGLFQLRHKVVHTVERHSVDLVQIKKYCTDVECLMHTVLDELKPQSVSFYYQKTIVLGKIALQEGRKKNFDAGHRYRTEAIKCYGQALDYLQERIKDNDQDIDAHTQILELHMVSQDHQNITKCATTILNIDPDEPVANYCVGVSFERTNPIGAIKHFKKSIDADPYTSESHYRLIDILMRQKKYAECLPHIDTAIMNLSYDPTFYMLKGVIFKLLKISECVEPYYQIADEMAIEFVTVNKDDVDACEDLLKKLQEFGRDDAIAKCKQIIDDHLKNV